MRFLRVESQVNQDNLIKINLGNIVKINQMSYIKNLENKLIVQFVMMWWNLQFYCHAIIPFVKNVREELWLSKE